MTKRTIPDTCSPLHLGYFKAPEVDAVVPYRITRGTEVIELVTAGVVRFPVEGTEMRFGCGALFWHVAGDETIHLTDRTQPYECLCVAWQVSPGGERPAPRLSVISDRQRTLELNREILTAFHDESVDRARLGDYLRTRLLWEIHLAESQGSLAGLPSALRSATALVEDDFAQASLSVSDLARTAEISEPHLHSLFRTYLGQSPHRYLVIRRVREARLMLTSTSDSIKSISSECGFENIETFYRAFKQHVQMTPFEYRSRHGRSALSQS